MHAIVTSREFFKGCRERQLRLALLVVAGLCSAVLLAPGRAEATCGDYLRHHAEFDGAEFQSQLAKWHSSSTNLPAPPLKRKPCNGPSCQQGPQEAPLHSPVAVPELQERWIWMFQTILPTPALLKHRAPASEPVHALEFVSRLDRPPKFSTWR